MIQHPKAGKQPGVAVRGSRTMNKSRLAAALGFTVLWLLPAAASNYSGYDLYRDCYGELPSFCQGYLLGVFMGSELAGAQLCAPGYQAQAGQLQLLCLEWTRRNPGRLSLNAYSAATEALRAAFPCR